MGPGGTAEDCGFESRRRCFFFFSFFFFFHPCIKNATYGFLSRSGTFKKTSIQYQKKKKKVKSGVRITSLFLLYAIAGHNNTAIKITNTYSDDQLVIYIFKRQTQQKQ